MVWRQAALASLSALVVVTIIATHSEAQLAVSVDFNQVFQVIDGFGGSNAFGKKLPPTTKEVYDLLFSPDVGVGLSLLRTQVPSDGSCISANLTGLPADPVACAGGESVVEDMKAARDHGVRVWSTCWSPPAAYKTNKNLIQGYLNKVHYADYADYFVNFIKSVKLTAGVDLYALSIQNEPNYKATYASCRWSPEQFFKFIHNFVGPATNATGVRLMMPETVSWGKIRPFTNYGISHYVSIIGFHNYDGRLPARQGQSNPYKPRAYWQTESCGLGLLRGQRKGRWDSSMQDALMWARYIHTWLVNGQANAWHWWWLIGRSTPLVTKQNQALIRDGEVSYRLFVLGNFAKFIRPGFVRVWANDMPSPKLLVSAYKSQTSQDLVIVAVNLGPRINALFKLKVGYQVTSVTPWLTANKITLQAQEPIPVDYSPETKPDNRFTAQLPATSVTTFVYKQT